MSLKILGRWKRWDASTERQWGKVQENLHTTHAFQHSMPRAAEKQGITLPTKHSTTVEGTDSRMKSGKQSKIDTLATEGVVGSDDEESEEKPMATADTDPYGERELAVVRKAMRKWRRLAGLKECSALCDELNEGELVVNWTRVSSSTVQSLLVLHKQSFGRC